ncbi:hypothetical protein Aduo_014797 [Ancylostoma duodenale]
MSSVLLLQLVAFYLIHVTRAGVMTAPGSDLDPEELGTSGERGGGDRQSSSGGQGAIPKCQDGMKPNARDRLVKGVKTKANNPNLKYNCDLAKHALLEAGGSPGGAPHHGRSGGPDTGMGSSFGLSFHRPRREDYKPRKFVADAVKDWQKALENAKSSTRFGCGLSQTPTYYLLVCFFE